MEPFRTLSGPAMALPEDDIDTDIIFPARFLLHTEKRGLGLFAFADKRGPDFPLAESDGTAPAILVTGANFGCGSSREQAPWALHDLGVRAIVAPSFGEIFASNCLKNGILPIVLPRDDLDRLLQSARTGEPFTVDLGDQEVRLPLTGRFPIQIEPIQREALLNGWDEIAGIRAQYASAISDYETTQRTASPWLWTFRGDRSHA